MYILVYEYNSNVASITHAHILIFECCHTTANCTHTHRSEHAMCILYTSRHITHVHMDIQSIYLYAIIHTRNNIHTIWMLPTLIGWNGQDLEGWCLAAAESLPGPASYHETNLSYFKWID